MFDSLLNSKFYNKCKHDIKCIRARLDPIRKKKQAILRYLKQDVADLIANGFAANAFGRMEGLIVEINQASCYDMIDQFCEEILKQLQCLEKQRECTEEARVAVSTLIFAAARFPDLPELSKLRHLFTERYGSHIETYVSSEFVEKAQRRSFSKERRLQVMQNIAKELSIGFDVKVFERSLFKPAETRFDRPKKGSSGIEEPTLILPNGYKDDIPSERRLKSTAGVLQKHQVQVEPKDIHAVSNGTVSEKNRKLYTGKSKNTEHNYSDYATCSDNKQRNNHKERNYVQLKDGASCSGMSFQEQFDSLGQEKKDFGADKSSGEKISKLPPYSKTRKVEHDHGEREKDNVFANDRSGLGGDDLGCHWRSEAKAGLNPFSLEKHGVGTVKPVNGKSPNMVPPYTKPKGSTVENPVVAENGDSLPDDKSAADADLGSVQDRQPVRLANNDTPANMVPPYFKPKLRMPPLHDDQDVGVDRFDGVGEKDSPKNGLAGDQECGPVSIRKKSAKPPAIDFNGGAVDDENIVSRTPGGRRRHTHRRSHTGYDDDYNQKITDLQPQLKKTEMDNVIDNAKPLHRPPISRKNIRKQSNATCWDNCDEKVVDGCLQAADDEMDSNIDYGNLLHRIPTGHRRHEGRSTAAFNRDRDEEERIMDKLLMHYSRKGLANEPAKMRSSRPHKAHHDDDKVHSNKRDSVHPERASSVPAEPVSLAQGIRLPARATSLQASLYSPGGGCVHPSLPDYDELAARLSAMRKA